ncbi:Transcriptional regulator, contains XRE-family HTH domain [Sinosporangium album]|uniref:Transcriptional regulator, contains XRE-family HTH domain n=1 Tax=Sinosporangium album TaxID=504805 RepID=A0A1G8JYW5_9ACTN|nr:helix-turn-helix transcriptional regulator [Sinosporangium album]SDI36358.1 Transcriptional regulator, contains XRE-family HTH domain [Sinosporangium album]
MALPKVGSIGEYIREQRTQAKISLRQLAASAGVSNPYLSQIERGLRKPSAEILNQIAKGLHISARALYVRAGLMEDREAPSDVTAAIRADTFITERQRQVLIDIYESFRKENQVAEHVAATAEDGRPEPRPQGGDVPGPQAHDSPLPQEFLVALEPFTDETRSSCNGHVTPDSRKG